MNVMNDLDVSFARAIARRYVRDPEDAADVAQDALLAAYRHLASFRGDAAFHTWLYRIVATTALGHLRRRRRRAALHAAAGDRERGHASSPEAQVAAAELAARARQAVAGMGAGYADVFRLRFDEDRSEAEIADALGLSIPTVKIRTHRARRRVADAIAA
jgi:RNA polymerase sigma-70 factor (ECF subfamily)